MNLMASFISRIFGRTTNFAKRKRKKRKFRLDGKRPGIDARGCVDYAVRVPGDGIYLKGWFVHTDAGIREESIVSTKGRRVTAPFKRTVEKRPDVTEALNPEFTLANDDHGFSLYLPVDALTDAETEWSLEFVLDSGGIAKIPFDFGPPPNPHEELQLILSANLPLNSDIATTFANTVGPRIESLWAEQRAHKVHAHQLDFGSQTPNPTVSVIVPLYGRIDFLRFQIASFFNDADFEGQDAIAEIIYVLDDPPLEPELRSLAETIHATYDVPFRIVILSRNTGFSGANNAGARIANGEFLLLLNSDVLPKSVGWLSAFVSTHRALPDCGALGCRLLFEDGSIQHAGMVFRESELVQGGWENTHPLKGYPSGFDPLTEPGEKPAVTAACLLVSRSLYEMVGGLAEDYILADFEDSDFCLKLRTRGFKIWYTPTIELYHLERQSVRKMGDENWRQRLTLYNMWKHGQRWGATIRDLTDSDLIEGKEEAAEIGPSQPRKAAT